MIHEMTATASEISPTALPLETARTKPARMISIDATRGLVMFTMIYVNDLAGAPDSAGVPDWMKHASDIRPRLPVNNGMTFVDLVFPAFLFIVGLSIPLAIGGRLSKGEKWYRIVPHVAARTAALLLLGILMGSGTPDAQKMPWYHAPAVATTTASQHVHIDNSAGVWWVVLWYTAAFLAFCQLLPVWVKRDDAEQKRRWKWITVAVRVAGFLALAYLICIYEKTGVNRRTHVETVRRIVTFHPFSFSHRNIEILGLIAWAYLMGAMMFLAFRTRRLPLAVGTALLLGFWIADRSGSFDHFALPGFLASTGQAIAGVVSWVNQCASLGEELGALASITVAGVLLATILLTPDTATARRRITFTLWFIAATALAAMLVYKPFLIWKNSATPAWCLWACAITAALWLVFYIVGDVMKMRWLIKPLAIAGQNVLLAYLISEMMESVLHVAHLGNWYDDLAEGGLSHAVGRSIGCAVFVLGVSTILNKLGFRLKL
jgi:heparan-alpha-glucosaminide N-acetyltransferase